MARLPIDEAAERVANFLHAMTLEIQMLARACGKGDVHDLEPEDLRALTLEAVADHGHPAGRHPLGARPGRKAGRWPMHAGVRSRRLQTTSRRAPRPLPRKRRRSDGDAGPDPSEDPAGQGRLHPGPVGGHPRHAPLQGGPAGAFDLFLGGRPASRARRRSGMGQGPHSHDLVGMPDLGPTRSCPGRTGVARFAVRHQGRRRRRGPTARGRCSAAAVELAAAGYTMKVGVEAEHMLVVARRGRQRSRRSTRAASTPSTSPATTSRAWPAPWPTSAADRGTWSASAGSPTRRTTRTAPPSSSSTGSTPTRSPPPTATRSSR